ncbi:MAG: flavin-containing monooxygenase [Kineosporiaceae bacterium]
MVTVDPPTGPAHVDVVVVGAGLSGINAAHRLTTMRPRTTYAVLEAREAMGGTWDLFRYPGIRSDGDMFTFGYPFRPWREARSVADGPSIVRYIEGAARDAGIDRHIRYRTRVDAAHWSSATARWTLDLTVTAPDGTPSARTMTCSFLFLCSGYYDFDQGYTPHFPGIGDFRGRVVHPQFWPPDLDWTGRRVVVVGSGATAVTLIPSLAPAAAHVTMLQRSPSWITTLPSRDAAADLIRRVLPERAAHAVVRAKNVAFGMAFYELSRRRPEIARRMLRKGAVAALGGDEATVDRHFTPSYDPWDQRVCLAPDGDLFAEIRRGRASVVTDRIARFVPEGILLESGGLLETDLVVTATGLVMKPFGGVALSVDGEDVDVSREFVYRRMMLSNVPNIAAAAGYTNASWTLRSDITSRAVCRLLAYLERQGYDWAMPTPSGPLDPIPAMNLQSGYVFRGIGRFPRGGHRAPWSFSHRYPVDALTMRLADLRTEMAFGTAGRPVRGRAGAGSATGPAAGAPALAGRPA